MTDVDNLDANLEDYFELSFVMIEVGNLYKNLGSYLNYLSQWRSWVI